MDEHDWGLAKALCAIVAGFIIFMVVLITSVSYFAERPACYNAWKDFKPEWRMLGGCTIEYKAKRIPTGAFKVLENNKQ